jgi:geranylgeranyl diphosphate synthase type I
MLERIKKSIDKEQMKFIRHIDALFGVSRLSPLLFASIKEFLLRPGKKVRPILFTIGYLGFVKKQAPSLYRSALAIELLHDFLLIHDDIIDKSQLRRGKPSLHVVLNRHLKKFKKPKFNGQDLAIVAGDIIYALAIHAFLAIEEDASRKEAALEKFIEATIFTGSGEFIELLYSAKNLNQLSKEDVYRIYDFKTAYYTFACPLVMGAILAGAQKKQVDNLLRMGIYLGRAFQIKDDILGMFAEEERMGKSSLSDLQEAKRTLLIWHAYNHASKQEKKTIEKIFAKKQVSRTDLVIMRCILTNCGSLSFAENEISKLIRKAKSLLKASKIKTEFKKSLRLYCEKLLGL